MSKYPHNHNDNRGPGTTTTIFLYIFGLLLIVTAIIIVLRGAGLIEWIPDYAIWAIGLGAIGFGIIAGIRSVT
jgi:hypothetical protein